MNSIPIIKLVHMTTRKPYLACCTPEDDKGAACADKILFSFNFSTDHLILIGLSLERPYLMTDLTCEIHGFPVNSGINPLKTHTKTADLSEEPKGINLCFNGNPHLPVTKDQLSRKVTPTFCAHLLTLVTLS